MCVYLIPYLKSYAFKHSLTRSMPVGEFGVLKVGRGPQEMTLCPLVHQVWFFTELISATSPFSLLHQHSLQCLQETLPCKQP